jgi:hypothetical protein
MTSVDLLVLIPVIPALPILVTWWLPWERWIPWDELPKDALGPYVLYLSFAAWYFNLPKWCVALILVAGVVLLVMAVRERIRAPNH